MMMNARPATVPTRGDAIRNVLIFPNRVLSRLVLRLECPSAGTYEVAIPTDPMEPPTVEFISPAPAVRLAVCGPR